MSPWMPYFFIVNREDRKGWDGGLSAFSPDPFVKVLQSGLVKIVTEQERDHNLGRNTGMGAERPFRPHPGPFLAYHPQVRYL
jgi:hypothetical protein